MRARSTWSCALPWLKLRRTTFTPERIISSSSAGSLEAGPKVATILVARRILGEAMDVFLSVVFVSNGKRQLFHVTVYSFIL
ncbi:hypothetical protein D3C72_1854200 [compost metagenome]